MTINIPDSCTFWLNTGVLGILSFLIYMVFKVNHMYERFPKVCDALTRISEILLQKDLARDFIFSASPVTLTEAGIKALEDAKFIDFYNTNKKLLIDRINKFSPKTMADLEESCKKIMLEIEDTLPNFEAIKQYAYNNGQPIAKILFAAAIKLRDLVAKELNIGN